MALMYVTPIKNMSSCPDRFLLSLFVFSASTLLQTANSYTHHTHATNKNYVCSASAAKISQTCTTGVPTATLIYPIQNCIPRVQVRRNKQLSICICRFPYVFLTSYHVCAASGVCLTCCHDYTD